jgi:hypothetical protein
LPNIDAGGPVRPHTPAEQSPLERWLVDAVVTRMVAERPDLIIVNTAPQQPGFGGSFNYLGYFAQDARFAKLWTMYQWVGQTELHDIYARRPVPGDV